jgi:IPT/TIG domain
MKTLSTVLVAALTAFTLACGYSSKAAMPAQPGSMPAISALAPNTMTSRGPSFVLTVNGSNFSTNGTINWNGMAQTTTFVSANQLAATIAASDIAAPATVAVTVTNPATSVMATGMSGSGSTMAETSSAMNFTVN